MLDWTVHADIFRLHICTTTPTGFLASFVHIHNENNRHQHLSIARKHSMMQTSDKADQFKRKVLKILRL